MLGFWSLGWVGESERHVGLSAGRTPLSRCSTGRFFVPRLLVPEVCANVVHGGALLLQAQASPPRAVTFYPANGFVRLRRGAAVSGNFWARELWRVEREAIASTFWLASFCPSFHRALPASCTSEQRCVPL